MKFFKVIIFLIIFFPDKSANSQEIAGYRGKHWLVNYDLAFSPAFIYASKSTDDFVSINFQNSLGGEYIYQLYKSLTFSTRFYKTQVFFDQPLSYSYIYTANNYSGYNNERGISEFSPDTLANLTAIEFDLGIKKYSELLAPLGGFSMFEVGYITYKVDAYPSMFFVDLDDYSGYSVLITQPRVTVKNRYGALKICYTWGKQYVLFDKISMRLGISSGWVLGGLKLKTNEILDIDGTGYISENDYVKFASKNRLWGHNLLNFNMGIGFLAY